jgi:hypothetical protein
MLELRIDSVDNGRGKLPLAADQEELEPLAVISSGSGFADELA